MFITSAMAPFLTRARPIPEWRQSLRRPRLADLGGPRLPSLVLVIHNQLVRDFAESGDPIDPPGIRDRGELLESALSRPQTSIGTTLKYPTIEMAAAALLHALVHNHPFHNGNKR